MAGLGNDPGFLQFTAPIQNGNSGGPLLDQSANVIGIVTQKLDEINLVQNQGEFPQNVNFAIKANVAVNFLEANYVDIKEASDRATLDLPSIADVARHFTVPIAANN